MNRHPSFATLAAAILAVVVGWVRLGAASPPSGTPVAAPRETPAPASLPHVRLPPTRPAAPPPITVSAPSTGGARAASRPFPASPTITALPTAAPPIVLGYSVVAESTQRVKEDIALDAARKAVELSDSARTVVTLAKGDTVTSVALSHLAAKSERSLTAQIRKKIRDLNPHLTDLNRVKPGDQVLMPGFPVIRSYPVSQGTVEISRKPGAPLTANYFWAGVPSEKVGTYSHKIINHATLQEAVEQVQYVEPGIHKYVSAGRFTGRLTEVAGVGPVPSVLTGTEPRELKSLLQRRNRREAWLFILDTGWPDAPWRKRSLTDLYEILDVCWASLDLPKPKRDDRLDPAGDCPNLDNPHAAQIAAAIKEFVALDQLEGDDRQVRVVFIPVVRTQGADPLLRELAWLGRFLDGLNPTEAGNTAALRTKLIDMQAEAKARIEALTPVSEKPELSLDQCIVSGLAAAFERYAHKRSDKKPIAFVNLSWVIQKNPARLGVAFGFPGVIVAAAGNDLPRPYTPASLPADGTRRAGASPATGVLPSGGTVPPGYRRGQNDPPRDFVREIDDYARGVAESKRVVAVLNVHAARGPNDPGSLDATSAWTTVTDAHEGKLLGYEGTVGSGVYGTSFAAPRVAWFLALAEALRADPGDLASWTGSHLKWINQARAPFNAPAPFRFDPIAYLKTAAGP